MIRMIIEGKDKMIEHDQLTKEAVVFIKFLELEQERHQEDITKINRTIGYLKDKFSKSS